MCLNASRVFFALIDLPTSNWQFEFKSFFSQRVDVEEEDLLALDIVAATSLGAGGAIVLCSWLRSWSFPTWQRMNEDFAVTSACQLQSVHSAVSVYMCLFLLKRGRD